MMSGSGVERNLERVRERLERDRETETETDRDRQIETERSLTTTLLKDTKLIMSLICYSAAQVTKLSRLIITTLLSVQNCIAYLLQHCPG